MAEPMYRRIAEDLRQKIESGELGPGAQLPTELELRDQYDASRNTVRDAVKWLTTRRMIESRPGQGTFVIEKIDPFVTTFDLGMDFTDGDDVAYASEVVAHSRTPTVSSPRIEIHRATGTIVSELQLEEGSAVVSRHLRRYIDGTPWSLQTTFYPMRYVDAGARRLIEAALIPYGAVRYIEEKLGIKQVGWRDKLTVRAPDADEASFFKLPDDGRVAVFEIYRTAFEYSGTPIRLTITAYPADRNQFVMNVGRVPGVDDANRPVDAEFPAQP
jgi:GntR family transcriptional regulator